MTDSRRPSDMADKMLMRLPSGMRSKIADAAKASGRSMNAEVVARLEASFVDDTAAKEMAALVEQHEENITDLWKRMEDIESTLGNWQHYGAPTGRG